jgi:hypothetical protein
MTRIIITVALVGALLSGPTTTAFATGDLTDCSFNSTYQGERSWCLESERNALAAMLTSLKCVDLRDDDPQRLSTQTESASKISDRMSASVRPLLAST